VAVAALASDGAAGHAGRTIDELEAGGRGMYNAVACANNDVVMIAWGFAKRPDGCAGFSIHRIDETGAESPLPGLAKFAAGSPGPSTTDNAPVQKFTWKDPYARLVAETTGNRRFRYKVIPLHLQGTKLVPMPALPAIVTNEVTVGPDISPGVKAYFNRGLLSTQRISRATAKGPKGKLLDRIADRSDALRASLSGDMVEALTEFVDRAKSSGSIYAALYELHDAELLAKLTGLGNRLHVVLSNAMVDQPTGKKKPNGKPETVKVDGNDPARVELGKTTKYLINRILPDGHIGHNKYLVYVDAKGHAQAVLFGSTNWTPTGLCAQTNNTMVVDDPKLARRYLDDWKQLAADTKAAAGVPKDLQAGPQRTWDATGEVLPFSGAREVTSWFSPNTPKPRGKKIAGEARPPDMEQVRDRIMGAQHAVLFLAFYPGSPCIADWAADAQKADKGLFVRGCVTNASASNEFYYELRGTTPPPKVKGKKAKTAAREDPRVIAADTFDKKHAPPGWMGEMLKAGFAVIHDKIVVVDPFSDSACVITGSHNLGHKASYDNDENLVIVDGNRSLATAYATHVLDVYDHFAWRWSQLHPDAPQSHAQLEESPDAWLDRYYDAAGAIKVAQVRFWLSASVG
jgi:hypothetical protein